MDRRKFCKIALLAAGTIGLGHPEALASVKSVPRLRGRRLTVLQRSCFQDLQSLYLSDPECGPCRAFATGESFDISHGCPEGFCPRAWDVVERAVKDSSHCPENPADNYVVIASCPDGTRPVIFKIEL
ncbi:MAG: TIGR04076 family protein [Muribaculaceae bacterium]|nr:TIGR04076 family protein [Muribaculaceae bacterium]